MCFFCLFMSKINKTYLFLEYYHNVLKGICVIYTIVEKEETLEPGNPSAHFKNW